MNLYRVFVWMLLCQLFASSDSFGAVVAREDFDGGAIGLISSNVPTIDGGGGDTHAVGSTSGWPTTGGTPFSLVDTSVGPVGDSMFFVGDTEGVFGVNSNFSNQFLGISDTRPDSAGFGIDPTPVISTWSFNISGATDLSLSIGMGSMESSTFTYDPTTQFLFTYSIDGGPVVTAFNVTPDSSGNEITYRAIDFGTSTTGIDYLSVTGDSLVTKLLAETGLDAGNLYLDKTPASGPGAGILDTFRTSITGTGSVLNLTLSAYIPQEAAAFDNIQIDGVVGVPEPSSLAAVGLTGLVALGYRRRRKKIAS